MAHQFQAGITVNLPEDPKELAQAISVCTTAWAIMMDALEPLKPATTLAIKTANDVKHRGRPKGSKNAQPRPQLPVADI